MGTSTGENKGLLVKSYAAINTSAAEQDSSPIHREGDRKRSHAKAALAVFGVASMIAAVVAFGRSADVVVPQQQVDETVTQLIPVLAAMAPLSTQDPGNLNFRHIDRPEETRPNAVWGELGRESQYLHTSLPTNAWWQNIVLGSPVQNRSENSIATLPYTVDVNSDIPGLRVHFPRVFTPSDLIVMTTFDWRHAMQIGASEDMHRQHTVTEPGPLSITLQWRGTNAGAPAYMQAPLVRGSPYITMEYFGARPMLMARQEVTKLTIDGATEQSCSKNGTLITVQKELEMVFSGASSSDNTWLMFVAHPIEFLCQATFIREPLEPLTPESESPGTRVMPRFILTAPTAPYDGFVMRVALANNCTTGHNPTTCEDNMRAGPRNNSEYMTLLREHSMVYPTGETRVGYESATLDWLIHDEDVEDIPQDRDFDVEKEDVDNATPEDLYEVGHLRYFWGTRRMDGGRFPREHLPGEWSGSEKFDDNELLMFALPHHRESLSNVAYEAGGTPTLHGFAQLVKGKEWEMSVNLPPVSFGAVKPMRSELLDDINDALDVDINYELPENYQKGAGDTYFSGKMLAKIARIALIAEEAGRHDDAMMMVKKLTEGAQVWLDGTAESEMLYDFRWGGIFSCGCNFNGTTQGCDNDASLDECPAITDVGHNFGAAFYNDHHFHYGYHIYAAAVAAIFDPDWAVEYFENVLVYVRDIANPSPLDPFFPIFRHKDFFLWSSWALGIATLGGKPYGNGRNEESSSEAVNGYDAVALFGHQMAKVFAARGDMANANIASHVRDTGRMLTFMEIRAAQTYWHVKDRGSSSISERIYPDGYKSHVVGMLWSTLAQMQTWFGAEAWKVYGIQMLPITGISEMLLEPEWVEQLLPDFEKSCLDDPSPDKPCVNNGFSINVYCAQAIIGKWEEAVESVQALPDDVFESAGGDGHSRSNTLWWIATR